MRFDEWIIDFDPKNLLPRHLLETAFNVGRRIQREHDAALAEADFEDESGQAIAKLIREQELD